MVTLAYKEDNGTLVKQIKSVIQKDIIGNAIRVKT